MSKPRASVFSSQSKSAAKAALKKKPKAYGSRGDVLFNKPSEPNGTFSLGAPRAVTVGGLEFRTPEHFFQAMKFHGTRYVEVVRAAGSASQAKVAAAHPGALQYLREDWPDVKDAAMLRALVKLFAGDTDNVQRLMLTGEQRLVYSSSSAYWGVGADGRSGQNRVGQLLMQLRASFKDGSCPKDGVCTACRTADCWVSPLAALTVPYCSPACRKALGLPEEPGKPAWEEEKRVEAERVAEAHAEATAAMVPPATTKAGAAAGAGGTPR